MKKAFIVLLALSACLLWGCGGSEESEAELSIPPLSTDGRTVIVLDAGHGFGDPGCSSEYMVGNEADVTIDMVMLLQNALIERGAEVVLTHDGEKYPSEQEIITLCTENGIDYREDLVTEDGVFSAYERGIYVLALSKDTEIDFFVSVHVNSFTDPSVDRYELYYCNKNPHTALLSGLCETLSARLDNATKTAALDYKDAYIVTKYGSYPSLLVETGYASNEQAAQKLNSPKWREEFCNILAEEIINAILKSPQEA